MPRAPIIDGTGMIGAAGILLDDDAEPGHHPWRAAIRSSST
ncbi:MAG TPA: hypothetical protein VGG05_11295 [Pseudonocardiaceae bacterium]|jgi:hypothetical protein